MFAPINFLSLLLLASIALACRAQQFSGNLSDVDPIAPSKLSSCLPVALSTEFYAIQLCPINSGNPPSLQSEAILFGSPLTLDYDYGSIQLLDFPLRFYGFEVNRIKIYRSGQIYFPWSWDRDEGPNILAFQQPITTTQSTVDC